MRSDGPLDLTEGGGGGEARATWEGGVDSTTAPAGGGGGGGGGGSADGGGATGKVHCTLSNCRTKQVGATDFVIKHEAQQNRTTLMKRGKIIKIQWAGGFEGMKRTREKKRKCR